MTSEGPGTAPTRRLNSFAKIREPITGEHGRLSLAGLVVAARQLFRNHPHRSLKQHIRIVSLATAVMVVAAIAFGAGLDSARADDLNRLQKPALEKEKLREEIRVLREKNTEAWWERAETVPIVAALVAFLSAVGAFVNQTREYGRQRSADRDAADARARELAHQQKVDREAATAREQSFAYQQKADRAQRAADRQRRYDELFATTSANLSSENEALRLAAAASIEAAFLPDAASDDWRERDAYRTQVFRLLVSVLSLLPRRASDRTLAAVLAKALRTQLPILQPHETEPSPGELRVEGVFLEEADLSGLDLRGVSFDGAELGGANLSRSNLTVCQFSQADLSGTSGRGARAGNANFMDADLEEADFSEARMRGAHFDGARLVSAELRRADLANASFTNADLQGAHFDRAQLRSATFDGADLADAWFVGAQGEGPQGALESSVLESIVRAKRWSGAHWDPAVRVRLDALHETRTENCLKAEPTLEPEGTVRGPPHAGPA